MKANMTGEINHYIRTGIAQIHKIEWLEAFIIAHPLAFTTQNMMSGWSGTGFYPFNPNEVLCRVPILPAVQTPPRNSNFSL